MAHSYITDEMQCDLRFAILHVNRHENKNLICAKFSFFFSSNFFPPIYANVGPGLIHLTFKIEIHILYSAPYISYTINGKNSSEIVKWNGEVRCS